MKNKIVKIIILLIIATIIVAFNSSVFAEDTVMSEGEFADYVANHENWFWGNVRKGVLASQAQKGVPYFGADLTPSGGAAKKTNGACLYHLQKNIGEGNNYSRITNLIEFDGSQGKMIIYGGTNSNNKTEKTVEYGNANAVAKILNDAYDNKGISEHAASNWGATVCHAIREIDSAKKLEGEVHKNFLTGSVNQYSPEQQTFADSKYTQATKSKAVEESNIKFEDSTPAVHKVTRGEEIYTYMGPFEISGSGTIEDIIVGSYSNGNGEVRWSTTSDYTGLQEGCNIKRGKSFYIRVKADLTDGKKITVNIKTKSGSYYKARMALITYIVGVHSSAGSSQNLGIYRGKKISVTGQTISKTFQNTGDLEIIKQDIDNANRKLSGVEIKVTGPNNYNETFTTNKEGKISISNLPVGTYTIQETKNPYYGYIQKVSKTITIPNTSTVTLTNTRYTGNLQINKEDKDSHKKLKDVTFKIKVKNTNQYIKAIDNTGEKTQVRGTVNLTNLGFKNNKDDGTTFKTDDTGIIRINNLLTNTYIIEEIENPNDYGYTEKVTEEVTVTRKKTTETTVQVKTILNEEQTGNLRISKIDTDSGKKLAGVKFKIKNSNGAYIRAVTTEGEQNEVKQSIHLTGLKDANEYYATTFITNEEGIIEIHNLLIGDYQVIETSIGENDGYEIDDNYISWESNVNKNGKGRIAKVRVEKQSSENTKDTTNNNVTMLTVKNKKKYIDLKGYVWQDIEGFSKSEYQTNDHYQADEDDINDRLLEGITVQLKDENGQIIQLKNEKEEFVDAETTTNKNGEYAFQKVEINEMNHYQIEFIYNGMSYEAVEKDPDKKNTNGSKAEEINRDQFNKAYETITYGKSNQYDLAYEYDKDKHESQLLYGDKANYNYGYDHDKTEGREPVSGVDKQYEMRAITKLADIISSEEINKKDSTEVANINLGIKKRVQLDLMLGKELNSVKVSINGENHVYQYADRYNSNNNEDNMGPQVSFEKKDKTYTRALYASDVCYEGENSLQVKVTYKIKISLEALDLTSHVNEITDYYSNQYFNEKENVKVGKKIDNNGDIEEGFELEFDFDEVDSEEANYYKMIIKNPCDLTCSNEKVNANQALVYVQLEVKPEKIVELISGKDKLYNYAEITSYSTERNGKPYARIDRDSQPGNLEIENNGENSTNNEDDNDRAPGLQLILQEERKTDGKVFIDEVKETDSFKPSELNTEQIRQANGIYDDQEEGVEGVTVQLVKVDENTGETNIARVYNQNMREWEEATTVTNDKGEFEIKGFLPDNYKIVYTWGGQGEAGQKIRVQDYKGTVYQNPDRKNEKEWYKEKTPRYSDGMDNYITREEIDRQTEKITYANKEVVKEYSGDIEVKDNKKEEVITTMDSITPVFKVNIEYEANTEQYDTSTEYELDEDGSIKMDGIYAIKKEGYKNYLQHIDFGIVERAKQALQLSEQIKNVKVTLADGTVLVNSKMKEDGTFEKANHAVHIPKSEGADGQFKIEIDNEIIQSAKLEITYQLQITNVSEKDYVNREFYWYGDGHGDNQEDLVALKANRVIDYLDNQLAIEGEQENQRDEIIQRDNQNDLISEGLLKEENLLSETALIKQFDQNLTPSPNNNKETKTFVVNKLLTNISADDDMTFNNDSEIIEVIKTGGSSLITIPGNYNRSESSMEIDNDKAESVIIIPPTGLKIDYIVYTVLAITSLGILTVGIILIRKYVLR